MQIPLASAVTLIACACACGPCVRVYQCVCVCARVRVSDSCPDKFNTRNSAILIE